MISRSDTSQQPPFDGEAIPPKPESETRPLYWSIRRELWENRSIYLAPLIVAAVVLFGSLISTMVKLPRAIQALSSLDPAKRYAPLVEPFSMSPAAIMLTTFVVGFFYCIDALYGERRDRSILFWKSLPVSDRTTVLSKMGVPFLVLPLIAFALSVAVQVVLLFTSTAALLVNGINPAPLWGELRFFTGLLIMPYGLAVHALWFAPIYGWLLLVSAWAKRAPFLWVVLPPFAVSAVEKMTLDTMGFLSMLQYRFGGALTEAFIFESKKGGHIDRLAQLTPGNFLTRPGLWLGLVFAAAFLVAAMRLRRNREPI